MDATVPGKGPDGFVGWILVVASAIAVLGSVFVGYEQNEYQKCQGKVNDSFTRALAARSTTSEQDRAALDRLVEDIAKSKSSAETKAALELYRSTRTKADEERGRNPLPKPASEAC